MPLIGGRGEFTELKHFVFACVLVSSIIMLAHRYKAFGRKIIDTHEYLISKLYQHGHNLQMLVGALEIIARSHSHPSIEEKTHGRLHLQCYTCSET